MPDGLLRGGEIVPLLDDLPASFLLGGEDAELAAVIDQAAAGVLLRRRSLRTPRGPTSNTLAVGVESGTTPEAAA
jgi:hypothetical protein